MKLLKIGLLGYKRFREQAEMDVDADLVAIVGPNEAGKTSLLEALAFFDSDRPLRPSERTRGEAQPRTAIWARYLLDDEDRAALGGVPEAKEVRQCVITRNGDDARDWDFEPDIIRNFEPRHKAARRLRTLLEHKPFRELDEDEEFRMQANALVKILDSKTEYLTQEQRNQITQTAEAIRAFEAGKQPDEFADHLDQLYQHESAEHPWTTAMRILEERRPRFLYFAEDARDLHSSYSFSEPANTALHNLLALGGTTWQTLTHAAAEPGRIEGVLELVNDRLREVYRSWQQSELRVRLRVDHDIVHILVNMAEPGDYIGISDRSAGLRQFVALRAYIASRVLSGPTILLIDEAELHLHYDAQADLVEVLSTQEDAEKVIYTTHSAGCLPPDLGLGIRIVLPVRHKDGGGQMKDTDDSRIINWFWASELDGTAFNPILIGMGASTFAFSAMRRAIVGEGPADAILLPTMFREVMALEKLNFQVAPGLANLSAEAARSLDLVAARVVHLVDGDGGGSSIEQVLLDAGVPAGRILKLADEGEECVLEDLLDAEVYLAAVNGEIRRWQDGAPTMPVERLPASRRPAAVDEWCAENGLAAPGRRAVAHRVLEQRHDRTLVSAGQKQRLKKLYRQIQKLLAAS